MLKYYGVILNEVDLYERLKISKNNSASPILMSTIAEELGFDVVDKQNMTIGDLKKNIDSDIPVLMPLQAWYKDIKMADFSKDNNGHYVVAIGYGLSRIYFEDPSNVGYSYLDVEELMDRWHDQDIDENKYVRYGIILKGKKPAYVPTFEERISILFPIYQHMD